MILILWVFKLLLSHQEHMFLIILIGRNECMEHGNFGDLANWVKIAKIKNSPF